KTRTQVGSTTGEVGLVLCGGVERKSGGEYAAQVFGDQRKIAKLLIIVQEEEELVLDHRSAKGSAELMPALVRSKTSERIAGVELLISKIPERVSVISIGSGANDRVYASAGRAAEFGQKV